MNAGMILALVSGFLWSISNIIDKTIVTKYFQNPKLLFIPLSMAYVVIGGTILLIKGTGMSLISLSYAAAAGLAFFFMDILYFYSAKREEISRIVPLFSLSAVFVVIAGAIFLDEVFSLRTYFGIAVIVLGALLIMLKTSLAALFKSHALGFMLLANVMVAAHSIVTKYLTNYYSYWTVFGWIALFNGVLGLLVFAPQLPALRQHIVQRGWRGVQLVFITDGNGAAASLCFTMAASLWYISLTNAVSLVQYIFVFVWSVLISKYRPLFFSENITRRTAWQKITAILLIITGVILVS